MILLLACVLGVFPEGQTADWYTLLQSRYHLGCSADYLVAGNGGDVLSENLPMIAVGTLPAIPWSDAHMVDPLESGLWGGGRWNICVNRRVSQDSLSISRIGLIQNTEGHSRYVFQLDRPLPWQTSGNFEIARDDTLRLFSTDLARDSMYLNVMSWEGKDYGWSSRVGWASQHMYARAGFSRLNPGDRRPELLAGASTVFSPVLIEIGAAAGLVDSTVQGRGVAGISTTGDGLRGSGYFEYSSSGEGFWGGITLPAGELSLSATLSQPVNGELFETVAVRHRNFNLVGRFQDQTVVAADAEAARGIFRSSSAASWNFDNDSLAVSSWMLFGVDWYRGRFEAGPRVSAGLGHSGVLEEDVDVLLGFTLVTFSLAAAVEDLTHGEQRSWSFGITWSYTDQPPVTPLENSDRGGNEN